MTQRPRRRHMFVDDPQVRDDRTGEQYCLCGLKADNTIHVLEHRTDEQREHEARKVADR